MDLPIIKGTARHHSCFLGTCLMAPTGTVAKRLLERIAVMNAQCCPVSLGLIICEDCIMKAHCSKQAVRQYRWLFLAKDGVNLPTCKAILHAGCQNEALHVRMPFETPIATACVDLHVGAGMCAESIAEQRCIESARDLQKSTTFDVQVGPRIDLASHPRTFSS